MSFVLFLITMLLCLISVESNCNYKLRPSNTRNIIFVGKSRSGKSTTIEVLKNESYWAPDMTIYRSTDRATVENFIVEDGNTFYNMNIMDTPGLFEIAADEKDEKPNEQIVSLIGKCIEMEFTKINHVFFVFTINAGLQQQDIESLDLIHRMFLGMEHKLSVIISFSNDFDRNTKDFYIGQLTTDRRLKGVMDKIDKRVFFMGALPERQMRKKDWRT